MQITIIMQMRRSSLLSKCKWMFVLMMMNYLSWLHSSACSLEICEGLVFCFPDIFVGTNINLLPTWSTWSLSFLRGLEPEFLFVEALLGSL